MEQNLVNQKITDGNFDQSLAVKCINGTFVGKKADNITRRQITSFPIKAFRL